jgi:hypothetical protein
MRRISLALALVLGWWLPASAQIQGGGITGTVKDQQGGVLPGATATLQGADATRSFVTDPSGAFRFLELAPGPYKLTIALDGFRTLVREGVIVEVGKNVELPVSLTVGIREVVTVTAATPLVDRKATGTSTNITSDELTKIPTSRDPFALMRSVPGVLVDRVNIGGNETGQQSNFTMKGTRPQDAVWTLDGVVVTDMTLLGASPTYFNFDNFQEIEISTSGQDIAQPTGGLGMNFVVKRGTNLFHGALRGYFGSDALQAANVPSELAALSVTDATADHVDRVSDYGFEIGGPIVANRAWFYGSFSNQDIRLIYRTTAPAVDRTDLNDPNLKLNWQATTKDLFSFLYFDGYKTKDNRSPGTTGIVTNGPGALLHQGNAYTSGRPHGLWKLADDRVINSSLFVSGKYAYYNTGFLLTPEGGMSTNAGRDLVTGTSYGSFSQSLNLRPQHTANVDASMFLKGLGGTHDLKYGFGVRRTEGLTGTLWPGDGILALRQTAAATGSFAQIFREGRGANRADYLDFYAGDTFAIARATVNVGLRYDRQWGAALPSSTAANPAFPTVVPGLVFAGYDAPFTWKNFSPRIGATYSLNDAGTTLVRTSFSRYAGQLATGTIGYANPTANAGVAVYRWTDLDGDHLASPNEVNLNQFVAAANGFNPANPTAVTSANVIDPNLTAPTTSSFVAGFERELRPNLSVQTNYTYTRVSNLFGNLFASITPRVGVPLSTGYTTGTGFVGTLPDGTPYNVATYIPVPALVTAGGSGFLETNVPGYYTDNNGLEIAVTRRMTGRWMGRLSLAFNNAREHFTDPNGVYDTNGNPTPTITEPLVDGGVFAPQSTGNGQGAIYMNARWQVNANGLYMAPYGIELAANVFGRQGYPMPLFRPGTTAALGSDSSLNVLVSPTFDYVRYPNVWDTDIRVARDFKVGAVTVRGMFDVFNLLNADTALVRNGNVTATTFNQLAQNLSPRIARVGVQIGF